MNLSRTILPISALMLAGCFTDDNMYGRTWSSPLSDDTMDVTMPVNAPSIMNLYFELPSEGAAHKQGHLAIDIIAALGTPVIAPADGRVIRVFTEPMYGKNIVVDHGVDAAGRRVHTSYMHLYTQDVSIGETVTRGQQIGTLGRSGVLSGGVLHLHFSVLVENRRGRIENVDPNEFWVDGPGRVTCYDPAREWPDAQFLTTYPVVCK